MVDPRFYTSAGERHISALLAAIGRENLWSGDANLDRVVTGAGELDTAGETDVVFVHSDKFLDALGVTGAAVILHTPPLSAHVPASATGIASDAVQIVFSQICAALYPNDLQPWVTGIGPAPQLEEGVRLGANVSIGVGTEIGSGSVIGPNSVIGPGVAIGRNCVVGANCTIEYTQMGNDCVILPGARLGSSGFGYLPHEGAIVPVPQLGRTIIQDRVEIGANSVIDRGALGDTVIGEGTKIGNLVVVAHNCKIGRNCMLVGFIGLAGSVTIEDSVVMGGAVGSTGHITLGAGTQVTAGSMISKSFPPGSIVGGPLPSRDIKTHRAVIAAIHRLGKGEKG